MSWPKAMPVVEVVWLDSQGTDGWQSEKEYDEYADDSDPEDGCCKTTGYLFKETDKNVAIVLNQSHSGNLDMMMQIPKVAIVSRTVLREASKN